MTEQEDLTLVRQCLEGNQNAFGALIAKHHKAVFNVALRVVNDYQDAQDLTQAVFIKAYEKLGSFDAGHKFFSWIYRMAVNESLNFIKRRRRFEALDDGAEYAATGPTPAEDYEESEMSRNVQNALMNLEIDHRAVIVLKHFENLSYEEIGYILDIPEKTVKSRLFTARQVLKDIMIKKGYVKHDQRQIH
jgi:RNA polymerase sigma-70 factor (ECF subfamily)